MLKHHTMARKLAPMYNFSNIMKSTIKITTLQNYKQCLNTPIGTDLMNMWRREQQTKNLAFILKKSYVLITIWLFHTAPDIDFQTY